MDGFVLIMIAYLIAMVLIGVGSSCDKKIDNEKFKVCIEATKDVDKCSKLK
jgi:hypothetical protein